jgi:hypothetical protein
MASDKNIEDSFLEIKGVLNPFYPMLKIITPSLYGEHIVQ